ncbi:hypothetical protein PENFLA_c072G01623 [Penicillium flavigenum]|uniref:Mitochondrial thiamine pyrophosphate carrier 1 n=1 Tax=Penicillium flavigenum TaxID=254877 RepID=A0A1V6SBC7_9EURO|nr:hypothetical protein PENFLA_c072G01623 [Penicillium flavigenum]
MQCRYHTTIIAALTSEVAIHPMDMVITRMQSASYKSVYKHLNGTINRTLLTGLYQGFGPTLIAGTIGSAAFFTTYEASKDAFEQAQAAGYLLGVPRPVFHIASSAAAELLTCAILNPAEVLKQNAQVFQKPQGAGSGSSPTMAMLMQFKKQPAGLWAGYTALVTSQLPSVCLTFCLYEMFKEALLERWQTGKSDVKEQLKATVLSAGVAAGFAALPFVPIDVVKTRIRLAAGEQTSITRGTVDGRKDKPPVRIGPFAVARNILIKEGMAGLFRGSALTCVAGVVGGGLYMGFYEGSKLYLFHTQAS